MRDLLQVAARSGSGSAARALGSGLAGMRTATRRILILGGIIVAMLYLGWDVFSGITQTSHRTASPSATAPQSAPASQDTVASPTPDPGPYSGTHAFGGSHADASRVTYAIDVNEVAGLAPNVPPGTIVDIWVTWDRTVTKTPALQRLVRGAFVEEIAPPVTPNGQFVAILSVDKRKVENLLWGDRYGALSATIMPSS